MVEGGLECNSFSCQDRTAANARALELLDYLDVGNRANAAPPHFSGSEAQRAAIASALANPVRASFWTMKRPADLDSQHVRIVMDLIRKVASEQQAAILAVTYDEKVFDRIFHLCNGRLDG